MRWSEEKYAAAVERAERIGGPGSIATYGLDSYPYLTLTLPAGTAIWKVFTVWGRWGYETALLDYPPLRIIAAPWVCDWSGVRADPDLMEPTDLEPTAAPAEPAPAPDGAASWRDRPPLL